MKKHSKYINQAGKKSQVNVFTGHEYVVGSE